MSKNIVEERLRWVLPIYHKQIKLADAVKVCPYSKRSLERWLSAYRKYGIDGLKPKSTRPKTNPKETCIRIKERIIELRKETKKCALKLQWDLEKQGIKIHYQTIQKVIKKQGLTRKYRVRRIKYKYIKAKLEPGELVEIDIKYVPRRVNSLRYYQFTAIDCASRWRYLKIYDERSNFNAIRFLKEVIKIAPFKIEAIKTDNDFVFTNRYTGYLKSVDPMNPRLHSFDILCKELGIEHYLIDPGKPAQNGKVERSHRSDQESFYGTISFESKEELEYKLKLWNMYYNDLEHCALGGKTPNEFLKITN